MLNIILFNAAIFAPALVIGLVVGAAPSLAILSSGKSLIFFVASLALIFSAIVRAAKLDVIWRDICIIAAVQGPVCLYQYYVVAPSRGGMFAGDIPWDSVVGTMGGDPLGGGNSPTLAMLCLTVAVTIWARGSAGPTRRLAVCATFGCIAALMLAEVKTIFVVAPFMIIGSLILIRAKRAKAFQALIIIPLLSICIFSFYTFSTYSASGRSESLQESLRRQSAEIVDGDIYDPRTGEVGRLTALRVWMQDAALDRSKFIFGYGMGALAAETGIAASYSPIGNVARHYTYRIGSSALARMLWEYGLLVCIFAGLALAAMLIRLSRFSRKNGANSVAVFAGGIFIALPVFAVQSNALLDTIQMPLLAAFACAISMRHNREVHSNA